MIEYLVYLLVGVAAGAVVGKAGDVPSDDLENTLYKLLERKHKEIIREHGEVYLEVKAEWDEDWGVGLHTAHTTNFRVKEWSGWYHITIEQTKVYTDSYQQVQKEEETETLLAQDKERVIRLAPEGDSMEVWTEDDEIKSEILARQI